MDRLLEILKDARDDVDFENETKLIDNGVLDSFDIISIVSELNEAFGVNINMNDLLPENFNSAAAIYDLINKLQAE